MTGPIWIVGAPNFTNPACAEPWINPEWFYSADTTQPNFDAITSAKEVCRSCEHTAECLDFAIRSKENYGIWGGLTAAERRKENNVQSRIRGNVSQKPAT